MLILKNHKQIYKILEQLILIWWLSRERNVADNLRDQWMHNTANHQQLSDAVSYGFRSVPEGRGERFYEAEAAW